MDRQPVEVCRVGKYLGEGDMRMLGGLGFATGRMMRGRYAGQHATKQRGYSTDFVDYRQYVPGDDMAAVDWKVYGRTDRLYVKSYEHQVRITGHLLIDGSKSMQFRGVDGKGPSKFDFACRLAGAIGYLLTKQHDRVSISIAKEGLDQWTGEGMGFGHLANGFGILEAFECGGQARLGEAMFELTGRTQRQSVVMVFSDLLDDQAEIVRAMAAHGQRGSEVIVFHVMHGDELELNQKPGGRVEYVGMEDGLRVRVGADPAKRYQQEVKGFIERWEKVCNGRGIDYQLVTVGEDYVQALEKYLIKVPADR